MLFRATRLIKSFGYAFKGLFKIFHEEQNLQIQAAIALVAVSLGLYCRIKPIEWCVLLIMITMVILMEVINSAVERVADVLRPRINTYVKEIKDIAAAAVMLASLSAVIVGIIIFYPYLVK